MCLALKVHVFMGAYGGDSHKPSWIYSNCKYLLEGWIHIYMALHGLKI